MWESEWLCRYEECIEAIEENSPSTKVFCLIHKMDRAGDTISEQQAKFKLRSQQIRGVYVYVWSLEVFMWGVWSIKYNQCDREMIMSIQLDKWMRNL